MTIRPCYQAENVRGRPTEWYREHKRCSEFLLVMLHLQAVWAGYDFLGGSEITSEALERFLTGWTPAGICQSVVGVQPGRCGCLRTRKAPGSPQLYVGGRTERDFELVEKELKAVRRRA